MGSQRLRPFSTSKENAFGVRCLSLSAFVSSLWQQSPGWVFPDLHQRERCGLQAFSSLADCTVALASWAVKFAADFPSLALPGGSIRGSDQRSHAAWRYGALGRYSGYSADPHPSVFARSPRKQAGTLSAPSISGVAELHADYHHHDHVRGQPAAFRPFSNAANFAGHAGGRSNGRQAGTQPKEIEQKLPPITQIEISGLVGRFLLL